MFQRYSCSIGIAAMSTHFHSLKVKEVRKETNDAVSVALEIPDDLNEKFLFTQGQYLTFRIFHDGEELRRSYSICSSPLENEWRVAVKKVRDGKFSTFANESLKAGDMLEVMPPMGKFHTPLNAELKRSYVMFAAGSGITPILSLIKTILRTETLSQVTLFYSNKSTGSIIFKEELEGLKNKFLGRLTLHYLLSREKMDSDLFQGRLDKDKCQSLIKTIPHILNADEYFLCGPLEMIESVKESLLESGIDKKQIHFELFTIPGMEKKIAADAAAEKVSSGPFGHVEVKADGVTIAFELQYDGQNILDAAIAQGADLPFACKGGVCSTCKAKLTEGVVEMNRNYALEEDEVEDGYILTCQSHPRSEKLVVDFDQ
jgi:ring-1,2-phenylacetyl-CoA epoxidase subunit PaaE